MEIKDDRAAALISLYLRYYQLYISCPSINKLNLLLSVLLLLQLEL